MLGMQLLSWFLICRVVLHGTVAVVFILWQWTVLHPLVIGVSLRNNATTDKVKVYTNRTWSRELLSLYKFILGFFWNDLP